MSKEILKQGPVLFSNNGFVRKIDPSGVDEDGVRCWMTGFDKTEGEEGTFWGTPMDSYRVLASGQEVVEKKPAPKEKVPA